MTNSDPICASSGCDQYLHPKKEPYPMDYPVPDFGIDHDIRDSHADERVASQLIGHDWKWKEIKAREIVPYETKPLDVDMQSSLKNLKDMEGAYGVWDLPEENVQL